MIEPAPTIAYASEAFDTPADRLLRHVVAWTALILGGNAVVTTGLHVALAKGWAASPPSMSWSLESGWGAVVLGAHMLTNVGLVVGAVLLLRRSRMSLAFLRASVGCSLVLTALGLAMLIIENPTYRSYWSTPATAALYGIQFLGGVWDEALIVLLTLPPLARRMVGSS
ncbi:MAG: hypothetical protein M3478_08585 [Planctomycetota bacterium]|nr:hypothetical protein [Planctomycetota bacterium]